MALTPAQKRAAQRKGKRVANSIIKFMTPSKKSRPKRGYKHDLHH